eukprot:COSAG02_NODE_55057_length_292_cov_1.352332_1_plen_93_part_10
MNSRSSCWWPIGVGLGSASASAPYAPQEEFCGRAAGIHKQCEYRSSPRREDRSNGSVTQAELPYESAGVSRGGRTRQGVRYEVKNLYSFSPQR